MAFFTPSEPTFLCYMCNNAYMIFIPEEQIIQCPHCGHFMGGVREFMGSNFMVDDDDEGDYGEDTVSCVGAPQRDSGNTVLGDCLNH